MKRVGLLLICALILGAVSAAQGQGSKEYVTLEYGTPLTVPAEKVATFVNAHFNIASYSNKTANTEVTLYGGILGEIQIFPATPLHLLMPTYPVGGNPGGTGGDPGLSEPFKFAGGGQFHLALEDGGALNFTAIDVMARVVVLLEDAVVTNCCGTTGTEENILPLAAVVVPSDASGDVAVSLESSSDMVNWVPAAPGNYPATTSNKFFRARAELLGP